MKFPFDPIERANEVEKLVTQGLKRRYHRFRAAPYYGGIATADAVGCCLLCAYCWNYFKNLKPENFGKFYSPEEVARRLIGIARKRNLDMVRITGAEPILGEDSFEHFAKVVGLVVDELPRVTFVLETNGLLLGYREDFARRLTFPNLSIRICIKGWDEESFQLITGAKAEYFIYPLLAVKHLTEVGLEPWVAVMEDIFGRDGRQKLRRRMREMDIHMRIETEVLERYPYVMENLEKRGVRVV